jgi:hypothetical protein
LSPAACFAEDSRVMVKRSTPDPSALTVRERILLFCVGSGTDWQRAGVPGEMVTEMTVKRLVRRDGLGRLALTTSGRTALRALLPDLLRSDRNSASVVCHRE